MNSLGEKIRALRESLNQLLRQVAAYLDIDTALISKIERVERRLSRAQEIKLAEFYQVKEEDLLTLWQSNRILELINREPLATQGINKARTILKTLA